MLISNPLKNEKCTKKGYKENKFDEQQIWNQRACLCFLYLQKQIILGHISTFFQLWSQTRKKWLKKWKTFFYKHVLEFSYATINRLV